MSNSVSPAPWVPNLGIEHPAGHGPIAIELGMANGTISSARISAYQSHRGAEKLFETRDYRQMLMLGDRHDWNSSFGSELGLALTIEGALGISAPIRSQWIRSLMLELNRLIHHLRWLGESAFEFGEQDLGLQARALREELIDLHEQYSGGRLHPMLVQLGGMRSDVPQGWLEQLDQVLGDINPCVESLNSWLNSADFLIGIGVLSTQDALDFGVSGPVSRASGLELDLRLDDPSSTYSELDELGALKRCTSRDGDAKARFSILISELEVSAECVWACIRELEKDDSGVIAVKLPRTIRLPHGNHYNWTESPTGINGWFITSTGGPTPERVKLRTASFNNAQALEKVLVGLDVESAKITLMSWLITSGDLAK